ncbi:MAG: hypothetical protein WC781_05825 [Candidatus Pacearchaeota archaeon]|jgi:hypothetical protein
MNKYYKLYGKIEYIFDGNTELYIKVIKETKSSFTGYKIWNWRGNFIENEVTVYGELITINKDSLTAYQEIKLPKKAEENKKEKME